MPIPLMLALVGIVAAAAVATIIYGDEIKEWLNELKGDDNAKYADLIKKRLENGDYKVVCNVFDSNNNMTYQKSWEAEEIDPELDEIFSDGNRKRINI